MKREKSNKPVKNAYKLCLIAGEAASDPLALNFENGMAGTMMDKVDGFKVRKQALEASRIENAADVIEKWKEKFMTCSTMIAGVCFNSGNLSISDGDVQD